MRKFLVLVALIFACGTVATAQEQGTFEGYVGYQFVRQDVKFQKPAIAFDKNTDSHGFNLSVTGYLPNGDESKVGVLGLTAEVGANFDGGQNDSSLVTAMGGLTLKARNNAHIQPFVRVLGGVARQRVSRQQLSFQFSDADSSASFAVGTGLDINLGNLSRYKWRILQVDYLNTGFNNERNHSIRLGTGLVF